MPREFFTALIRSSTLGCSESYFTTASCVCRDIFIFVSFTPFTCSSADCTVDKQSPHVIPLICSVTVFSFAGVAAAKGIKNASSAQEGGRITSVGMKSLELLRQPSGGSN